MLRHGRGAWVVLRIVQRGVLLLLLVLAGTARPCRRSAEGDAAAFLRETTQRWCQTYPDRGNLQAVSIEVTFRAEPPLFARGEGVVVAPVAIELPGAQHVVELASRPASLRKLTAGGITALSWDYPGRLHRRMRFLGVALVERRPARRPAGLEHATFESLPAELRPEALARAVDLEEHGLEKCAVFPEWARAAAGEPPYPEQVLRLVRAAAVRRGDGKQGAEDVCAALREGRLTPHWAQVAVVMAARELGIPSFAFAEAAPGRAHLVGIYTDRDGWILADVEQPDQGWTAGGAPLVTMAPLLGAFAASPHGFWYAQGAAYAKQPWGGGVSTLSSTVWRDGSPADPQPTDTTEARSVRLAEVCR